METSLAMNKKQTGLSLVELIISMALMGMIVLSVANFVIKGTATAGSLNMRFSEVSEIQMLINDIQQDLQKGAYISDNSYDKRLEYTTYTSTGAAQKKIYKINGQYLQLSTDNGSTWISPYRVSPYDEYVLQGTPRFLYSSSINNCTDFKDDVVVDSVWTSASDSAAYLACTSGTSSPVLPAPSDAKKVDLQGFQFSTGKGTPEATRVLPSDLFISLGPTFITSTASMTSPAVNDNQLAQSFATSTANLFSANFKPYAVTWDPSRERLIIAGQNGTGTATKVFITDRKGLMIGTSLGFTTATTTNQFNGVAVKTSGTDILALDSAANKIYGFSLIGGSSLTPSSTLDISTYVTTGKGYGIAYDAGTPNDIYLLAQDASSNFTITERNATTGAIVGTAWSLPAAFDATHPPGGLAIEPVNGDFIVTRNYVNNSGTSNAAIDIYVIPRSIGTTASFSVNINNLGSIATVANPGGWGIAYEPITNHIFLTDIGGVSYPKVIYEVIPSQLISPQS
jgi:Tfp pilus assembly protein PilV